MTNVVIFGAGGLGGLVHDTLLQAGTYRPTAFLDSDPRKHGRIIDGLAVRGSLERVSALRREGTAAVIVAIGNSRVRVRVAEQLRASGMRLVSAIHPLASIASTATLGDHLIIGARAIVCVHASIDDHCVLSTGSIVEHDNQLDRGVFLHPAVRLAGGVRVGEYATLGIGASVIPYRKVGRGARVEAGAVVIQDVIPGSVVAGAPAVRVGNDTPHFIQSDAGTRSVGTLASAIRGCHPNAHSLQEHKAR
jgi:sugar O-acyltransferase (sialic acid O-acetyltransferase NeuD family)